MTKPMPGLREFVEKSGDAEVLREMIGFAAERLAQRDDYRDRDWQARAGNAELCIPKLRTGSYFPSFLEPRRAVEKAPAAVIQEACVHGVSTRVMDDLVRGMGGTGISKS